MAMSRSSAAPGLAALALAAGCASPGMDIAMSCTWSFALQAGRGVRVDPAGNDGARMPGPARTN